jgi:hypothetical protein
MHYNTERYHKRRQQIIDLLGGVCVSCGSKEELEIHHKDPETKSFDIGSKISKPWAEVLSEAAKCELRCSPCHREEHASQHGLGGYMNMKCRCDVCRFAWNVYHRDYKKARRAAGKCN